MVQYLPINQFVKPALHLLDICRCVQPHEHQIAVFVSAAYGASADGSTMWGRAAPHRAPKRSSGTRPMK